MAIVENSASEINDVILIQSFSPIFGIVSLTGYIEVTTGETGTRFFDKKFSYSIDGVFFSGWIELTQYNISQIVVNNTDAFYINYMYTRSGTDVTGNISFVSIELQGIFDQPLCPNYFILPKSIFKDFFCYNPEHSHLCAVLTNKLFEKGILPEYITRNEGLNPQVDDEDFLSFWGTVCCFYALILLFGKKIEQFDSFIDYLQEYLKQKDVFFCPDDSQLQDLNYLKSNYFDEIRQRGTIQIFKQKGIDNKAVNGEFLRLICYSINDEFFFELCNEERLGWWGSKSSPSYKGTSFSTQLIKGVEKSKDFITLSNYNTYTGGGGSMSVISDSPKQVALLSSPSNGKVIGFGPDIDNMASTDFSKAITVDERLDYEITFWVKQNVLAVNISFGCYAYDVNNNYVNLHNIITNVNANSFFVKKGLNKQQKYYFVRGIVYNKFQQTLTADQARLNIGFGNNLKMSTNTVKIIPYLVLDRTDSPDISSNIYVWDFKVRPLVKGLVANKVYSDLGNVPLANNTPLFGSYSTCFLTSRNLLQVTYKNNNDSLTTEDIDKIAREKLIPYNSLLKTNIIQKV